VLDVAKGTIGPAMGALLVSASGSRGSSRGPRRRSHPRGDCARRTRSSGPYYNLTFRFDPEDLIARYIGVAEPTPMAVIHRELALQIKADWRQNGRIVRRLREALQIALILLIADIVAWLFSITELSF
jgi:hypothetical protein